MLQGPTYVTVKTIIKSHLLQVDNKIFQKRFHELNNTT